MEIPASLRTFVQGLAEELENGTGAILLKGFPFSGSDSEIADVTLRFSRLLGHPASQTKKGELVTLIRDEGGDSSSPYVRGHKTSAALPFHCDRTDQIGLLCIRPSARGGCSQIASAIAVRDILRRECPTLLQELYRPFPQDKRGEELPKQRPWMSMPIFFEHQGRFVSRYIRRFIESASRFPDAPCPPAGSGIFGAVEA